ncbi:histidine kinase [Olivibacter sp. LS-1]|uniref:sensor histidine kinase n=2 Tax=unclassified Olivibacter TaxID=2632301 RepID=UPI0011EB2A42|nr:histidine kinase [Olivibacter sp. LS-1]QEL02641.1 histidine kinase [Olivibacter sp. LS-1]
MTTHFPAVDNGRTRKRLSLPRRTILAVSLAMGFFLIYPNIAKLLQGTHAEYLQNGSTVGYVTFFVFRYLYFSLLCYILLKKGITEGFETKIYRTGLWTFGIAVVAYLLYVAISYISDKVLDWFSVILLFQFMTMWAVCTLMGYAYSLYAQKLEREQEIEQLRLDNLQSQYEALTNQVNPHFFFNSLNSLSALVRNGDEGQTLTYIQNLSNVFRYVLGSEGRGLVSLEDELAFLDAFYFLQRTRHGDHFCYKISIPGDNKDLELPVLSLLPILENIPKHNVINGVTPMEVSISINTEQELVVTNPIRKKIDQPGGRNGIGIANLQSRFRLLMGKDIVISDNGTQFTVRLPLKQKEV